MSSIRMMSATAILMAGAALAGCTNYYKITDPSNGKTFYTNNYSQTGQGAVKFKDAQTGSDVTIQNSTVSQLKKEQYDTGLMEAAAKSAK